MFLENEIAQPVHVGGLGRSIVKDRFSKQRRKNQEYSSLHTTELQDGYDWGRLNLQSVTEQSNLDDFLATAELAGTEFNAEKLNVKFIDPERDAGLLSAHAKEEVYQAQQEHKDCLTIPRRPRWDESTTPEELNRLEKDSFLEWRRELSVLQEKEHIVMTPFEKNLEFWRQLWRVIERSDIVVQIVDARNPLLFRCEDLEAYVKEVNPNKVNAILVNKADLLTQKQREMWADYFSGIGVKVLFWSALLETEKLKKDKGDASDAEEDDRLDEDDDDDDGDDDDDNNDDEGEEEEGGEDQAIAQSDEANEGASCARTVGEIDTEVRVKGEAMEDTCKDQSNLKIKDENIAMETGDRPADGGETSCDCADRTDSNKMDTNLNTEQIDISEDEIHNTGCLLSGTELLERLKLLHRGEKYAPGQTTIGLVGYPNVGKSSTINAILEMKKVPVSATPGRTKHFQTLFVEPTLMLCDCPGLVMPSFVSTKAEMIISGILPIDQMRDYIPPVALVCQRIPRNHLEQVYGFNIRKPREGEDPNRPPTAHELLTSYGYMRGFMTHKGIPDLARSSRLVLKDYVHGKLPYCHPPPGVDEKEFEPVPPPPEKPIPFKHKGKALRKMEEKAVKPPPMIKSEIDEAFFAKNQHKVHSKGIQGVDGFTRKEGLSTHHMETDGTDADSVYSNAQRLIDKPWKRHNNKNKKEKLRRKHAGGDQHEIM